MKREQKPKSGRNEGWAQANMDLHSRNNTVPAKRGAGSYKRPKAGARGREW